MFYASAPQASENWWANMWQTPDQRGEQLLNKGDAATAAHTYTDPRRKAYAQLKAGDYSNAAQGFSAFDDSDAHYNRGNALARSGNLQAALSAYDTALVRNPQNQDARKNRELVAQAIQQHEQPQQQSSDKNSSQPQSKNNASQSQQQDKNSSQQSQPSTSNHSQEHDKKAHNNQDNSNKDSQQDNAHPNSNSTNPMKQQSKPSSGTQNTPATQNSPTDEKAQAQHDVATSQNKKAMGQNTPLQKEGGDKIPKKSISSATTPQQSEQQLSQEQWLRRIPDDPGGLLQRKFMIEHMIKQQEKQP